MSTLKRIALVLSLTVAAGAVGYGSRVLAHDGCACGLDCDCGSPCPCSAR